MKRLHPWLAPLMMLVLLWTMVIAPSAVAQCEHPCGASHLHVLGDPCDQDDGSSCPDGQVHCEKTSGEKQVGECKAFEAGDAALGDHAPLKAPSPTVYIAVYATVTPLLARIEVVGLEANRSQAPPEIPPRETHGRGALPLLI